MMKTAWIVALVVLFADRAAAQWQWHNPIKASAGQYVVQNQGWDEDGGNYHRLPLRARNKVSKQVWNLSCESAGLAIRFATDAEDIQVKYKTTGGLSMAHMPATGVSGVDLYREADQGFCFGSYAFGDTVRYKYHINRGHPLSTEQTYTLYLPLYNGVDHLEIGVPSDNRFAFVPASRQKPIVVYGTSIAQGACASRPGMAWTNIVSRSLHIPLINLGFSGNGKLEPEVIDFINEQNACIYILDCMANLTDRPDEEIIKRVKQAVRQIRQQHDTPILLVEHAGYSNGTTNQEQYDAYTHANAAQAQAYKELRKEKVKNLFYLSRETLGYHPDSWVDYVHPSDLGMMRQATAIIKKIKPIIK